MKDEKLLILSPHTDDESLGCGGLIAKTIDEGGDVFILVFSKNYMVNYDYKEFNKAIKILGVSLENCIFADFETLKFDIIGIKKIVSKIESVCNKIKPTTVTIPFIGSFHQDHIGVAKAAMIALRPHGYVSKKVLFYEQPYYGTWTTEIFKPNYYVNINNYLDKKMEALKCYNSQKVPFKMVDAMAKIRGGEVGVEYAEAYMLMREIV